MKERGEKKDEGKKERKKGGRERDEGERGNRI